MEENRTSKLEKTNFWEELLRMRDEERAARATAIQIVRGDELPQEVNRQGLMRWYLHPAIEDTILRTLLFFEQEIPPGSKSGTYLFQGEQVIYILEGHGYTLVDGVKHRWEAGDVLNLPVRKEGVVVQHVNEDTALPAKFVAAEPNLIGCTGIDRGSGFEQIDEAPEYRAAKRANVQKDP